MPSTSSKPSKIIARAIGRRKEAVASVYLTSGSGDITINGHSADTYFSTPFAKIRIRQPFSTLAAVKYNASIKVHGGGLNGQLDAAVLGIARALVSAKSTHKPELKKAKLLTRDSRGRQRRNVGMGGKSRRRKQSPKR